MSQLIAQRRVIGVKIFELWSIFMRPWAWIANCLAKLSARSEKFVQESDSNLSHFLS